MKNDPSLILRIVIILIWRDAPHETKLIIVWWTLIIFQIADNYSQHEAEGRAMMMEKEGIK